MYEDIISHILKENQRYHEALEEIASCSEQGNPIYLREVARKVLKKETIWECQEYILRTMF